MKKAFSTVETLVALTIVSVVVIAIYLAFVLATQTQIRAKQATLATTEAERSIETRRNSRFADLVDGQTQVALANLPKGLKTETISTVNSDLKKIRVEVTWGGTSGTTRSVVLETFAAKGGLNDVTQ